MNLARVKRRVPACGQGDDQPPFAIDPLCAPPARGPRDHAPAQRVAGTPGLERRLRWFLQATFQGLQQALQRRLDLRFTLTHARGSSAQPGGELLQPHGHVEADAQHRPALLRPSLDEDPGELGQTMPARGSTMSFGHLI